MPFHSPSPWTVSRGLASHVSFGFPSLHLDSLLLGVPLDTLPGLHWDPRSCRGPDCALSQLGSAVLLRSRQTTAEMRVNSWLESHWCCSCPRCTQRGRCGRPTCRQTNRFADRFGSLFWAPLATPGRGLARSGLRPGMHVVDLCACPSPIGRRRCCLRAGDGADSARPGPKQSAGTASHRRKPIPV